MFRIEIEYKCIGKYIVPDIGVISNPMRSAKTVDAGRRWPPSRGDKKAMATKQLERPATTVARARVEKSVPESIDQPDHADLSQNLHMESGKRRMPETLRKHLLKVQGGKLYLPAAFRIVWFRDECPDWGVTTELIEGGQEAGFATVKASVFNPDGRIVATGHKTETRQDFPAGWVEKAETGAVARALALVGFGTQFSPELDDDDFADSPLPVTTSRPMLQRAPRPNGNGHAAAPVGEVWEGPGQCPKCHAPEGKRHGRPCVG